MVGRFLARCLLLAIPIAGMLAAFVGWHRDHFPAPHATNNLALNEKAAAFSAHAHARMELLAFGSSMSLNNLSSDVVTRHFGTTAWFNLGAWGLDMSQTCALAQRFATEHQPRTVVITGNLMDFAAGGDRSSLELDAVVALANEGASIPAYVRHPAMAYYLRQAESNRIRYNDRANYECLMMDAHGGVALDVPRGRIIAERWTRPVPGAGALDDRQYDALHALSAVLARAGTQLIYIGAPYRAGVVHDAERRTIAAHDARVRAIIEGQGHRYVDAGDRDWPDELYCDSSHLNGDGARLFTGHVLAKLPS